MLDLSHNRIQFIDGAIFVDIPDIEVFKCDNCQLFQVKKNHIFSCFFYIGATIFSIVHFTRFLIFCLLSHKKRSVFCQVKWDQILVQEVENRSNGIESKFFHYKFLVSRKIHTSRNQSYMLNKKHPSNFWIIGFNVLDKSAHSRKIKAPFCKFRLSKIVFVKTQNKQKQNQTSFLKTYFHD